MRTKKTRFTAFFMICALLVINAFTLSVSATSDINDLASQCTETSVTRKVPGWYTVVVDDALNVRSTPDSSDNNNIIGTLPNGYRLYVYSISEGWAKIRYSNQYAYVSVKYLKEE